MEFPDTALTGTGLTPEQFRLEVAVALYRDRKASMGRAAQLAGLSGTFRFNGNSPSAG